MRQKNVDIARHCRALATLIRRTVRGLIKRVAQRDRVMSCLGNFIYVEKFALAVLVQLRNLPPPPLLSISTTKLELLNIEMPRVAMFVIRDVRT